MRPALAEICSPTATARRSQFLAKAERRWAIRLPVSVWQQLYQPARRRRWDTAAIPVTQKRPRALTPAYILRIVRRAALRAGIDVPVSPHWLRHAHASHALDRGAPIHLVQATLGPVEEIISTTGRYLHCRPEANRAPDFLKSRPTNGASGDCRNLQRDSPGRRNLLASLPRQQIDETGSRAC